MYNIAARRLSVVEDRMFLLLHILLGCLFRIQDGEQRRLLQVMTCLESEEDTNSSRSFDIYIIHLVANIIDVSFGYLLKTLI